MSGDRSILSRRDARRLARRGRSKAKAEAIMTNSSSVRAASSLRPRLESWLQPARPTTVRPTRVTTGTPIQNESRLVVWPLYGIVSSPMPMLR